MKSETDLKRIIHIGLGNFHRAHQAWYTARVDGWFIVGVVMTNEKLRTELSSNSNKYTLGTWTPTGLTVEEVDVYSDVLLAAEDARVIVNRLADANTHIVTLTITEKGYHLSADGQGLDISSDPIRLDLESSEPKTAIGLLAMGLALRFESNSSPITIISCDNLSNNGDKLRQIIVDYLSHKAPQVLKWVDVNVSFPNSMVDRITPRLTDNAIAEIEAAANHKPCAVVGTEEFSEWVIEDNFRSARPEWETVGVQLVESVASFEERKLRLLNASHSYLAYAGLLAGHTYVHEAIADETIRSGVERLWDEAGSTVSEPAASTIDAYREALLRRFTVPEMRHSLAQIAMDGSLKLRERIAPIVAHRAQLGLSSPMSVHAVQIWAEYLRLQIQTNCVICDPNENELKQIVQSKAPHAIQSLAEVIWDAKSSRSI